MAPLVSILIPAYNAERWIYETIESALNQTWPKKEIIVVDDGSSDNTLKVARGFESNILKVVSQHNKGACAARNQALCFAQGDYIQWLDADDLLAPDKISFQLKESCSDDNKRILFSSGFGTFFYRFQKARFLPSSLWFDLQPVEWLLRKFYDNVFMMPATWLVSRRITEEAGPWDERLSLDDDGEYFCRVVVASDSIKFVPEAKSYYRQANFNSISNSLDHKACVSLFLSLNLCVGYLLALENSERTRAAALAYLQTWLLYFYPDKKEMLTEIQTLANELGGDLHPPDLSRKYDLTRRLLGWKISKTLVFNLPRYKVLAAKNWDRLIYGLSMYH